MACLATKRAEWVIRLKAELQACKFALFVTLTYSDDTIPIGEYIDEETGEVLNKLEPSKRDCQLFLKRLRKRIGDRKFRYFLISEYGDKTHRPHYHGIFFFRDIKEDNFLYDSIHDAWGNGFVKFGEVTDASIAYCTKYVLKLTSLPLGIKDTFTLMSRHPALGEVEMTKHVSFSSDQLSRPVYLRGGQRGPLPRLWRDRVKASLSEDDKELARGELFAKLQKSCEDDFATFSRVYNSNDFRRYDELRQDSIASREDILRKRVKKQSTF